MDRSLYISANAAKQSMTAIQVNNSNLANVNSTGFKEDLIRFDMQAVPEPNHSRMYTQVGSNGNDFSAGSLITTNRELDHAIQGDGFFVVKNKDGSEAYTRAGNFQVSSSGALMTQQGNIVMGNNGPVTLPPYQKLEITADGTINVLLTGDTTNTLSTLDRIKLVNPSKSDLSKGEDGLFYLADGQSAPADSKVRVMSGTLESSNVNTVHSLVKMIDLSRFYESQVNMMKTIQKTGEASSQILQIQ
jgi:flagellar basal-body rod protein FlgF